MNSYSAAADSFERILAEHEVPEDTEKVMRQTALAYQWLASCEESEILEIACNILVNTGMLYEPMMGYASMVANNLDLFIDTEKCDVEQLKEGILENMEHFLDVRTAEAAREYYRSSLSKENALEQAGENGKFDGTVENSKPMLSDKEGEDKEWTNFTTRK